MNVQSLSRINKRTECALLVLLIVSSTLWGQSTPRLAFDVASIKQSPPDEDGGGYTFERGGRTVIKKFTLKNLIMVAWHVQEFQVTAPAAWMDSTRYDIEAKAGGNPSNDQSRLMLQSLLLERFHLVVFRESKKLPIFVLRRAGALKAGLIPDKNPQCTPTDKDFPVDVPGERPFCQITFRLVKSADNGTSMLVQGTTSISAIERLLSTIVERQVTDQTNLSGVFDLKLEFRPDDFSGRAAPIPGATNSTAPSIFTAVQEQLGLKLVQTKGPVEVLVIDHAEEPTPN
ncbi:MAG TPA: TIGR03435 family protein [Candidatus Acidoferrales bacterium]|nr:TIGR03435 family protein [Candidatus Acidoferrales bacterium]